MNENLTKNNFNVKFPHIKLRILAATFVFYIPFYRDLLLHSGAIEASSIVGDELLKKGISIGVYPGGAEEALYATPKEDVIVLSNRFGFIKMALRNDIQIVPVFTFNEGNLFDQFESQNLILNYSRNLFKYIFGITIPFVSNLIPMKTKCTTVIGKPIKFPKIENPTDKELKKYSRKYMKELEKLYEKYSFAYSTPKNKKLRIL